MSRPWRIRKVLDRGWALETLVDGRWWVGWGIGAPTVFPREEQARSFARVQKFLPEDEVRP